MKKSHSVFTTAIILLSILLQFVSVHGFFFSNMSSIPHDFLQNATAAAAAWDSFRNFSGCRPGQKFDGLSKMKKYFNQFGYIDSNSNSNFTDDFDDLLESAIKTYQKNFNLNVTGELDDQTLQQIIKPRCGNADIVNGSTTMNSGKPTGFSNSSSAFHTVGHYSYFPGTPRWSKQALTYAFLPGNALTDEEKSVFSRAFARWSNVIPMTFTETSSYAMADIRIAFYNGDHNDGEPFDGVLGTLAHAFSPPSGILHLDGEENWVVTGDVTTSSLVSAVDLESVAVHEIGHLLGLGHSSVESAIMYPTISSGMRKTELDSDDVTGIQSLYGSNPSYNGSSSVPAVREGDTSGAHILGSLWGVVGVLLSAVGSVLIFL